MPSLPRHLRMPSAASKSRTLFLNSLNFYRVHLMFFTLVPLFFSGIMYGINTEYEISYIDCLFNCMSAMTVTGLATVNLSTLSVMQQVLLFVQMIMGSITVVSIVMIIVRRHFFQVAFKHVIQEQQKRRSSPFSLSKTMSRVTPSSQPLSALKKRFSTINKDDPAPPDTVKEVDPLDRSSDERTPTPSSAEKHAPMPSGRPVPKVSTLQIKEPTPTKSKGGKKKHHNISKGMIKRVEGGGVGMVNPMGWYDGERAGSPPPTATPTPTPTRSQTDLPQNMLALPPRGGTIQIDDDAERRGVFPEFVVDSPRRMNTEEENLAPSSFLHAGRVPREDAFPRTKTIAFDDPADGMDHDRGYTTGRDNGALYRTATHRSQAGDRLPYTATSTTFPKTYSLRPSVTRMPDTKMSGFGGFPTPFELARAGVKKFLPKASETLTQTLTMPRTATIGRRDSLAPGDNLTLDKEATYISFAATVGRNSRFTGLTEEQMDELGGVEYRSLRILLYIVVGYVVFLQLAGFVIIAPYISAQGRYNDVFEAQPRLVKIPWFALFQSVSAFSNTGMSLVDMSMIPFQRAYLMSFVIFVLIFAGNTAFPVLLRLTVWCIYKMVPKKSQTRETLKFLLDHPRRCFIYLFPSTQTWVLAFVMLALTLTDWVCFLVLDIGTEAIEALPVGTRIVAAFLQSAAVRAAGFAIVPLGSLAPAVKVLYTIMMYISVYPIALSVRSTNVYEERSLGLFNEDEEEDYESNEVGAQAVAKYLGWHARRQLAFDIWWLGFALWLICIIERGKLTNPENAEWFDIFNIIFELVSGYGTVGLSLGLPYDNYSLSGSFRKLSKLVVIAVMLRGRHRGLPVAIDRAVMLPKDFTAAEEQAFEETRSRRLSRRGSSGLADDLMTNNFRRGSMSQMSQGGPSSAPLPHHRASHDSTSPAPTTGVRTSLSTPGLGLSGVPPSPQPRGPPIRKASVHSIDMHLAGDRLDRLDLDEKEKEKSRSLPLPLSDEQPQSQQQSQNCNIDLSHSPSVPTNLTFALPRTLTRSSTRSDGSAGVGAGQPGGVGGTGSLTPVQEGSMSRANSRVD